MKILKQYIINKLQESIQIDIQNELELHFYSEFVLNESIKYSYFNIFEKNGSYIGQKELLIDLSKKVYNIIRNHEPENTIQNGLRNGNIILKLVKDGMLVEQYSKL